MIVNHYGFKINKISDINEINNKADTHFQYIANKIKYDLLYKPTANPQGLLVTFPGGRYDTGPSLTPLPMFRLYDYSINGISLLALSDPIIDKYRNSDLRAAWFLDTYKYKVTNTITEIINKIIDLEETNNVLFFGTSGGGFPAIKYSSILNKKALISNSPLYLDKFDYYDKMVCIFKDHDDYITDEVDIDRVIENKGQPQKVILFQNCRDVRCYKGHADKFAEKHKEMGFLEYNLFYGKNPVKPLHHHHIQWNCRKRDIIKNELLR